MRKPKLKGGKIASQGRSAMQQEGRYAVDRVWGIQPPASGTLCSLQGRAGDRDGEDSTTAKSSNTKRPPLLRSSTKGKVQGPRLSQGRVDNSSG